MITLLLGLIYALGFAFFLGYARGWRDGALCHSCAPISSPTLIEAIGYAAYWPIGLACRFLRGERLL